MMHSRNRARGLDGLDVAEDDVLDYVAAIGAGAARGAIAGASVGGAWGAAAGAVGGGALGALKARDGGDPAPADAPHGALPPDVARKIAELLPLLVRYLAAREAGEISGPDLVAEDATDAFDGLDGLRFEWRR